MVDFGTFAHRVSTEKQLLDTHGIMVGQRLVSQGLSGTCSDGKFTGDTESISNALFDNLDTANAEDREYRCEELDGGESFKREEGDPSGPPGTFRRYRVSSTYNAAHSDTNNDPNAENEGTTRSVIVEVREINGKVERPRPQIMFVLDYSGSMRGDRITRLKNAMGSFVDLQLPIDYGVVLFNSGILEEVGIGFDAGHANRVKSVINRHSASGGTAFRQPLERAVRALNAKGEHHSYILLLSDGQPNSNDRQATFDYVRNVIRGVNPNICVTRTGNEICHTIYGLGVDGADMEILAAISGNAKQSGNLAVQIASQEIGDAIGGIVDTILCSFGPLDVQLSPEEVKTLNVFLNDQPLTMDTGPADAEVTEDFTYDADLNMIKLYGNACDQALEDEGKITIRYGEPRIIPESDLYNP
jgi:Mg-chelatase subunit ChlD